MYYSPPSWCRLALPELLGSLPCTFWYLPIFSQNVGFVYVFDKSFYHFVPSSIGCSSSIRPGSSGFSSRQISSTSPVLSLKARWSPALHSSLRLLASLRAHPGASFMATSHHSPGIGSRMET